MGNDGYIKGKMVVVYMEGEIVEFWRGYKLWS